MRRLLLLALLCAGCATSNSDAPRAQFDPPSPYAKGLGEPDPLPNPTPPAIVTTKDGKACVGECKDAPRQPCDGACKSGEFCDTSSGIERCQKDVVPAAAH